MVLKFITMMMALNFPGLFGDGGLMQATPEDGQTGLFSGDRSIPGGLSGYKTFILDSTPETITNDATVGTVDWTNLNNAKVNDAAYADVQVDAGAVSLYENSVRLFRAGVVAGDEKSDGSEIAIGDTSYSGYGGNGDNWGASLTPAIINSANFGVGISVKDAGGTTSKYLLASNWGFSIPAGATILGVYVEIERQRANPGPPTVCWLDHFRMTIYYIPDTI